MQQNIKEHKSSLQLYTVPGNYHVFLQLLKFTFTRCDLIKTSVYNHIDIDVFYACDVLTVFSVFYFLII